MMPLRVVSEPLGGSPLALAAQRGLASEWYPERPRGADAWRTYLQAVAVPHRDGAWWRALEPALEARGPAAARLQRVAESGGVVVSTGQQAGLFGGPLYTLIKAISALAIADALELSTGVPTAPVFWAATDDADFEEASWAAVAVTGGIRMLRVPPPARTGVAMSRVPLTDVGPLVEALVEASGAVVEPRPLELARAAFVSGATLGNAYLRLMRGLLEPLGIAVLDASNPALRECGAPVLRRALERGADLERALRVRQVSVRAAGYTPQVEHLPDLTLVFAEEPNGDKQRIPQRRAREYLRSPASRLGPNVLLRPVLERFIMPSAGYVAGPGELAYFAQVSAVAAALGVPSPLPLPRWSATILEPRIERLLERLGIERDDLRDRQAVETRLARANLSPAVAEALRTLRRDVDADLFALAGADRDHLVPDASVEGVRHWVSHRLDRLERRYAAAVKRRETQIMQDIATVSGALYPNGKPQERALNFIPFWARYGAPLIDAMRVEALEHARSLIAASAPAPIPEKV